MTGMFNILTEALAKMKLEPRELVQFDLSEHLAATPKLPAPDPVLPDGRTYFVGFLCGRCANGSEGGAGTLNHVVLVGPGRFCAAKPQQRVRAYAA